MTLEKVKCRPAFTYSSHSQGSSTVHRHILLSVGVSNNYFLLAMATTLTNLGYQSPHTAKVFLTSSSEPQHWKVLAIRCMATVFIRKQKSPAPSRRSSLPALLLVLGPDSLAHDCVLRASFLFLELAQELQVPL